MRVRRFDLGRDGRPRRGPLPRLVSAVGMRNCLLWRSLRGHDSLKRMQAACHIAAATSGSHTACDV
jgi:hypothetical protein